MSVQQSNLLTEKFFKDFKNIDKLLHKILFQNIVQLSYGMRR